MTDDNNDLDFYDDDETEEISLESAADYVEEVSSQVRRFVKEASKDNPNKRLMRRLAQMIKFNTDDLNALVKDNVPVDKRGPRKNKPTK